MLLVDHQIRKLCVTQDSPSPIPGAMIEPFSESVSGNGVISYGLDHAGYCLRLAPEIVLFKGTYGEVVDPKFMGDADYRSRVFDRLVYDPEEKRNFVLLGNSYFLGRSYEYIRIPRWLKGRCVGKSTLARAGILINTTPLEPGWEGHLTIEVGNVSGSPVRIHLMEGIAQLEFERLDAEPETDYGQKKGIYQHQTGVTPPRVRS